MSLGAQGVASGGARPVSLEEAVKLAQQNAPAAIQARGQIRTSDAAIRSVYGSYLPSLSLSYGSNKQGGETFFQGQLVPFRGDPWNLRSCLNSSWNSSTADADCSTCVAPAPTSPPPSPTNDCSSSVWPSM
ncbi:MAG: TolC family protein [Gemmatimonadetes bacterium]|nr:TolC family protein [Gemmatimonadota bacterium]